MNSNNKYDCMDAGGRATQGAVADDYMAATAPGSLAAFPPSMEVRSGGTTPEMGEVEHCRGEFIRPGRLKSPLYDPEAVADDCMDAKPVAPQPGIKMVRYRLDVGCKHQVTLEELKRMLIEESGVDKNNINNINIQSNYTLVELPDEMPQDIFLHLKSVEIKQHKLDIKRVKARNNKRGKNCGRRARQRTPLSDNGDTDQVSDG